MVDNFTIKKIPKYIKNNTQLATTDILCDNNIIPKNIFLCYKYKQIPSNIINQIQQLNPLWNIQVYGDLECYNFINQYYDNELAELFNNIPDGPIKADLFRICVLYIHGGVYIDLDCVLLKPLEQIILPNSTFGVGGSYILNRVDPAFLFSTPNNKILFNCIELYKNTISKFPYSYWHYSIVFNMAYVLSKFIKIKNKSKTYILTNYKQQIQIFKETVGYNFNIIFKSLCNLDDYYYLKCCKLENKSNSPILLLHSDNYNSMLHQLKY